MNMLDQLRKKDVLKLIGILCIGMTEVCSASPKPTASSWINLATATIANVIDSLSGNTEVKQKAEWNSIQDFMENTREKIAEALNSILPEDEVIGDSLENFRQSLPDLSSIGPDFQQIRENLYEWDWDTFVRDMLPPTGSKPEDRVEDDVYKDAESIPVECSLTVPEIIKHSGYPCEVYQVETNDGYLLELHRIPFGRKAFQNKRKFFGKNRPVVFFQHGLLADSACWVSNGADRSLPFILADHGSDVWLGNVRGSTYSRAHKKLDPNVHERYWRFTWQHMAQSDLPAMVNKALQISGQKSLYYVGHSQGTLIAFARLSEDPYFNDKIKMLFAFGPVTSLANITSPVRSLMPLVKPVQMGASILGGAEILPKKAISQWISAKLHAMDKSPDGNESLIYRGGNMMMYLCGVHPDHYHEDRLPVYFSHTPAGTSLQNLLHLGQLVASGKMHKWDYFSDEENMKYYGQTTPPEYDISRIQTPVALFVGEEDQLAHPVDNKSLSKKIKNLVKHQMMEGWDHLDFLWGKNAVSTVYQDVLKLIENLESTNQKYSKRSTSDEL